MKIGFMSAILPELSLEDLMAWTGSAGFNAIELACWPVMPEAERRYGGVTHIDVDQLTDQRVAEIRSLAERHGLTITSLGYYPNPLTPDTAAAEFVIGHLQKVITAAAKLGVPTVGTFIGRNPALSIPENLKIFAEVWGPIVAHAAAAGVRIGIENCPMLYPDTWPGGTNLAISPEVWDEMFTLIPDPHLGLNFDPSHLVWQGIDINRAVRDFKDRIVHTHAKDTRVLHDQLAHKGIFGWKWWIDKLPGLGDIDWGSYISTLYEVGYDFVISVEHEDRAWESSTARKQAGLTLARDYLSQYIG